MDDTLRTDMLYIYIFFCTFKQFCDMSEHGTQDASFLQQCLQELSSEIDPHLRQNTTSQLTLTRSTQVSP